MTGDRQIIVRRNDFFLVTIQKLTPPPICVLCKALSTSGLIMKCAVTAIEAFSAIIIKFAIYGTNRLLPEDDDSVVNKRGFVNIFQMVVNQSK